MINIKNVILLITFFYISSWIISIITPEKDPSKYSNIEIKMFSLIFLFPLNNTNRAVPLPVRRPLISDAKLIVLFRYNSVNITLAPQLGIRPIRLVINGPNKVFFKNILDKYFSPL